LIDDNVLHQLQKLMAHLELSERSDYNPFEFCFAFKDLDKMPTNTAEQKDAQEFLNLMFDRLENLLKNTSRKYLP
jgi:ubiquitin carboxyl-terminal hydrolase 34